MQRCPSSLELPALLSHLNTIAEMVFTPLFRFQLQLVLIPVNAWERSLARAGTATDIQRGRSVVRFFFTVAVYRSRIVRDITFFLCITTNGMPLRVHWPHDVFICGSHPSSLARIYRVPARSGSNCRHPVGVHFLQTTILQRL